MANVKDPTPEELVSWQDWCLQRPPSVRAVAERLKPWVLYRMKSTGQRVLVMQYDRTRKTDKVTVTVAVLGRFNLCLHESKVYGIDPNDLVECDLPGPDEKLGAMMTNDQVEQNIDKLRVMKRSDLWILDENGKAVRRN